MMSQSIYVRFTLGYPCRRMRCLLTPLPNVLRRNSKCFSRMSPALNSMGGGGNGPATGKELRFSSKPIQKCWHQPLSEGWSMRFSATRHNIMEFRAGGPTQPMTHEKQQLNLEIASAVLLIDDNAIQAATRQTILRRAGYFVIVALSPTRALEQFQRSEFPAEISVVITDHIMPGMNGAQFVRELRKIRPRMPVMVISGLEEAEYEYNGLNVHFLLKPLPPDTLLANLRNLVAQVHEG